MANALVQEKSCEQWGTGHTVDGTPPTLSFSVFAHFLPGPYLGHYHLHALLQSSDAGTLIVQLVGAEPALHHQMQLTPHEWEPCLARQD